MSTLIRSAVIAIALVGTVSAASAQGYGTSSAPVQGKVKHDARDFFKDLKKNGS